MFLKQLKITKQIAVGGEQGEFKVCWGLLPSEIQRLCV